MTTIHRLSVQQRYSNRAFRVLKGLEDAGLLFIEEQGFDDSSTEREFLLSDVIIPLDHLEGYIWEASIPEVTITCEPF